MQKEIKLIDADISIDDRGELIFCNNFDMTKIKRFYHNNSLCVFWRC